MRSNLRVAVHRHLSLADRNHATLLTLMEDEEKHAEWISTVAFYKAVQRVEALIYQNSGRNSHDHTYRLRMLKLKYPGVFKHFRVLYSASTVARYLCDNDRGKSYSSFRDYFSQSVIEMLVHRRLRPIEDEIAGLLRDANFTRVER